MPAIAEETDQERRLREEQEAQVEMERLLATRVEPPDIQAAPAQTWRGSSTADIDALNAQPPLLTGERTTIDSPQYAQELARAQRGSGFLAPDVSATGEVIAGGYDPAIAEAAQRHAQAKLAAQAERFAGVQGYQQSLKSGATPAEALALWGQKMFAGDPKGLVNLATRREPVVRPVAHKPQWGKPTRAALAQDNNFAREIGSLRSQLAKGGLGGLPLDPAEADVIKAQIAAKEQQRVQALEKPEFNPNVDLTGIDMNRWNNPPARPTVSAPAKQAAAPAKAEVSADSIREQFRAGKLSREEAKKALGALGFQ